MSSTDANLYFLCDGGSIVTVGLHVDDLVVTRNDEELIHWWKNELCQELK